MFSDFARYQNSVIIAPKEKHDDYLRLREKHPDLDFKLFTLEEMEDLFFYHYDNRALVFLLKKGHSYDRAIAELNALTFLKQDRLYSTERLSGLLPLQKELLDAGLLYAVPFPARSFEGKNIIIHGYHDGLRISSILGELHNMAVGYDLADVGQAPSFVASFEDAFDELHYVYNLIAKDIDEGTPIDDIFIAGLNEGYDALLPFANTLFGFSIEEDTAKRLIDSPAYRFWRSKCSEEGVNASFSDVVKTFPFALEVSAISRLIGSFGDVFGDQERQFSLFDDVARDTQVEKNAPNHIVRRMRSFSVKADAHVYLVNFAMGLFPPSVSEDPFLTDEACKELNRPTSQRKSHEKLAQLNELLSSGCVKSVSFHQKEEGTLLFLSALAERNGYSVTQSPVLPYEYSHTKGRFLEASLKDRQVNYLYEDPRLASLSTALPLPEYRSYDYRYTPFHPVSLTEKRQYSPTQLKRFFGCPFSYYVERVLGIRDEESNGDFRVRAGTLFHKVLENAYRDPTLDFSMNWQSAVRSEEENHGVFTPKENALLLRLGDECQRAVSFYREHDAYLKNPVFKTEESFSLPLEENPLVSLTGKYDKTIIFGDTSRYYVIVDYKSGSERFDENLLPYGLSLQLPLYAYAAFHSSELGSAELIGLFIAPLLSLPFVKDAKKSYEECRKDSLKLEGVFANDIEKLAAFDPTCRDSSDLVRSLAYSSKGFRDYSLRRAKSPAEFVSFAQEAANQALQADERIRKGDFVIRPVVYKNAFDACEHCHFRDICYRKDEAVVHLPFDQTAKNSEGGSDDE